MNTPQRPSDSAVLSPGLTWPPGFAGWIAKYIYDSAQRPVPEVAIVATLGLLSGICGKSWITPTLTGLNQYIILVARSAIGKEAMHRGISMLMKHATKDSNLALARDFVNFSDFASGPALLKGCLGNHSFVNVTGEFGLRLKQIATNAKPGAPEQTLRRVMVNLYSKSGPDDTVGGISYSNKDNNVDGANGIAYSLIGETTPGTFYELITPDMVNDGFMSRFSVVEYEGDRPPPNEVANIFSEPWPELSQKIKELLAHSLKLQSEDKVLSVYWDCEPEAMYKAFNEECDSHIRNAGDNETFRQMWNRAALKALKNACLLAVADYCYAPFITANHMQWAISFLRRDIAAFTKRIVDGDIGIDDASREAKLQKIAREFLLAEVLPSSFKKFEPLRAANFIPRSYLQNRTQRLPAFSNHRLGSSKALEETIESLIKSGIFAEAPKLPSGDRHGLIDYGYGGKAYRLVGDLYGTNIRKPDDWFNPPTLGGK